MRERGVRAEVYPEAAKQARQFAFAEKKGIAFGLFVNEGAVNLRDLRSREDIACRDLGQAAEEIKRRLGV